MGEDHPRRDQRMYCRHARSDERSGGTRWEAIALLDCTVVASAKVPRIFAPSLRPSMHQAWSQDPSQARQAINKLYDMPVADTVRHSRVCPVYRSSKPVLDDSGLGME
jgi:hypothetical protein